MRAALAALAFVAVALLCGYGAGLVGDALGLPGWVAPAGTMLLLGAYVMPRRGRELDELIGPAFAIAYAGFVGLALGRAPHLTFDVALGGYGHAGLGLLEPQDVRWPLVLLSGVVYALGAIVFVAVPLAMIPPRRRPRAPALQGDFWMLLAEHEAFREDSPMSPSSSR